MEEKLVPKDFGTQTFEPEGCQTFVLLNSSLSVTAALMVRASFIGRSS